MQKISNNNSNSNTPNSSVHDQSLFENTNVSISPIPISLITPNLSEIADISNIPILIPLILPNLF